MTMLPLPKGVTELLFDGDPAIPNCVTFAVRVFPETESVLIYASLDSKSLAGAYRFALKPGTDTVVGVRARLYARRPIAKPGIAPLTSMYLFGENDRANSEDYRP